MLEGSTKPDGPPFGEINVSTYVVFDFVTRRAPWIVSLALVGMTLWSGEIFSYDHGMDITFKSSGLPFRIALIGQNLGFYVSTSLWPFGLLPIAGFRVDARCDGNMLRVTLTRPSGTVIRADEQLTVATSDFIAGGGDGILAPAGPLGEGKMVAGAPLLREALVAWLRSRGGQLNEHQFMLPEHRRWSYPGSRPVVCQ